MNGEQTPREALSTDEQVEQRRSENGRSDLGAASHDDGVQASPLKAGPAEVLPDTGNVPAGGHLSAMYRRVAENIRLYANDLLRQADFLDSQAASIDKQEKSHV